MDKSWLIADIGLYCIQIQVICQGITTTSKPTSLHDCRWIGFTGAILCVITVILILFTLVILLYQTIDRLSARPQISSVVITAGWKNHRSDAVVITTAITVVITVCGAAANKPSVFMQAVDVHSPTINKKCKMYSDVKILWNIVYYFCSLLYRILQTCTVVSEQHTTSILYKKAIRTRDGVLKAPPPWPQGSSRPAGALGLEAVVLGLAK